MLRGKHVVSIDLPYNAISGESHGSARVKVRDDVDSRTIKHVVVKL